MSKNASNLVASSEATHQNSATCIACGEQNLSELTFDMTIDGDTIILPVACESCGEVHNQIYQYQHSEKQ